MIATGQDKIAAALLHTLADAMEELAVTQAGESSHPAVLEVCQGILLDVGHFRVTAFRLVHGRALESGYVRGF